jgi:hypothetical protein
MLVNTDAVIKARVTIGTSKYQASRGSLAAPSIVSAAVLLLYKGRETQLSRTHWSIATRRVLIAHSDRPDRQSPLQTPT